VTGVIVDLSHPLGPGISVYPGDPPFRVDQAATLAADGVNVTSLHLGTHAGTHVDAPFHLLADGASIDALALELFTGPAVVVDVRGREAGEAIGWDALAGRAAEFRPGAVVLLHTGWSRFFGTPAYLRHPWLTGDAARRLVAAGVRTLGVDTLSPDPTPASDSAALDLPVHHAVLGAGGVIAENLAGLEQVTFADPRISLFPLPIAGADGAPVRAVAWPGS